MFCKNCGKTINNRTKFCGSCGVRIDDIQKSNISKKFNFWRIYGYFTGGLIILLTIFFGLMGSYEEGFTESFIGIVMLSGIIGILLTLIFKWYKKGFVHEKLSENLTDKELSRLKGLDGWLGLVLIGLFISIGFSISGVYESITLFSSGSVSVISNPMSEAYIKGYSGAMKFELIGEILFLIFAVYLAFLFFKKSKRFPKYYIPFLLGAVIFATFDYIIFSSLTIPSDEVRQAVDEMISEQTAGLGRSVLGSIIWSLYILKSKRVKARFVEK